MAVNRSVIIMLLAFLLAGTAFMILMMTDFDSVTPLTGGYNLAIVDQEENEHLFSLNDLSQFPTVEGFSSYENQHNNWRGYGYYVGVSLADLINGIAILKKDELAKKEISFKFSVDQKDMNVLCDKSLIEHVLINLINNATDAVSNNVLPKNKGIEIKSWINDDQHQVISIKDNGNGIPENLIEEIFIPFFTTKEDGSGIGLSLSRQIMHLHGGSISVQSIPKQESVFTLTF